MPEAAQQTTEEPKEPKPPSLQGRAVRGTIYSLVNVGGGQVLRLAGNLITTRLLFPEAFGLMLGVMVLNQGLQMISDVGILPSIIQHKRGEEPDFLNTAWTLQVVRGVALTGVTLLCAWPWAQWYGGPNGNAEEMLALILVASVQGTITGLDSTKLALLNRRMQVGHLTWVNILMTIVTQVVMIGVAYATRSVWSLLAGAISGEIVRMIVSHVMVPGPSNRFRWEKEAARDIFHFGKWIFISTLVTFLGLRFDTIVLPRVTDDAVMGIYSVGQSLASLPVLVTGQIVIWVLLPGLSEAFREDRAQFAAKVHRARRVINAAGVFMMTGTAAFAPPFFYLLYDDRYHDAGWMVQLLMVSTWFFFLQETSVRVQLAMGDSRVQMISNIAKLIVTAPTVVAGYYIAELPGLILGLTVGSAAGYGIVAYNLGTRGIPIIARDLLWTLVALVLGLAAGATPWFIAPYVPLRAELLAIPIGLVLVTPYGLWAMNLVRKEIRATRRGA
jgi:O-antigen/teichoic acid export membrane protein